MASDGRQSVLFKSTAAGQAEHSRVEDHISMCIWAMPTKTDAFLK